MSPALLASVLAATVDVAAGEPLGPVLARARPGDVLRLGAGTWREALSPSKAIAIEGAGPDRTFLEPPEGSDGVVLTEGTVELSALSIRAGPSRCALKVNGGEAVVREAALRGESCGAFLGGGRMRGEAVELRGGLYGLLADRGEAVLDGGSIGGGVAGAAVRQATIALSGTILSGPSREAALSVSGGGEARLRRVTIAAPGPSGISVSYGGRVEGDEVIVAGAAEQRGALGDCVLVLRGELALRGGELLHCGGAALESSGGTVRLDGVDAEGGSAGCIVLVDGSRAELQGNRCTGRGPALVLASGSQAVLRMNRWRADPAFWVDCGSGARAQLLYGEQVREPCAPPR